MSQQKKQLLKVLEEMNSQQLGSLLDYAQFLQQQSQRQEQELTPEQKLTPVNQLRPEDETVINAIKRLRASYFMLNTDKLLNQTSSLMTQFMMQGRDSVEVIDDLETLFEQHYQDYLQS